MILGTEAISFSWGDRGPGAISPRQPPLARRDDSSGVRAEWPQRQGSILKTPSVSISPELGNKCKLHRGYQVQIGSIIFGYIGMMFGQKIMELSPPARRLCGISMLDTRTC